MIEPRAWANFDSPSGVFSRFKQGAENFNCTVPLVTVADVLAALRQPSQAMIDAAANAQFRTTYSHPYDQVKDASRACFLAMLDQFERDQGSAT